MSNILVNPQYCAEDKDIDDFIRAISVSVTALVQFLRKRGVYVSKDAQKSDLSSLIAKEVFAWEDVQELLLLVTEPLRRESHITAKHYSTAESELIEEAVESVKTFRLKKYGDVVNCVSIGDGSYRIQIDYVDTFWEKTRLIQKVEREAEIIIQKTEYGFKTVRSSEKTAKEVELAILGEFERLANAQNQKLETRRILFSQLATTKSKVHFFTSLMEGIPGFEFKQIRSVKVQSGSNGNLIADSQDGDELAEAYASKIESLVLNGRGIEDTKLYDTLLGDDYVPIAATWIVTSDSDDCRRAEVRASFSGDSGDSELSYTVSAVWRRTGDGEMAKEKPSKILAARFSELLSEGAENALAAASPVPPATAPVQAPPAAVPAPVSPATPK